MLTAGDVMLQLLPLGVMVGAAALTYWLL